MADNTETVLENDLLNPPWDDETPLDQIPEEHRARVAAEREAAARQPLRTWDDDTPLEDIPEEHRATVAEGRKAAAEAAARSAETGRRTAAAAEAAKVATPAKSGSGEKTRARRDAAASARAAKPATGARARKPKPEPEAKAPVELVGVVLKTSRFTNPATGRNVARRTAVKVPIARAMQMVMQDLAREATPEETRAATIVLD